MATVHLREQDFRDRFTVRDFIDACRQAFELYGAGEIVNPPRQEIVEVRDGRSHFRLGMPAAWPGRYEARKESEPGLTEDACYDQLAQGRSVPLGRVAEAEEAGDVIAFLASERASYLTGIAVNIDGGASAVL